MTLSQFHPEVKNRFSVVEEEDHTHTCTDACMHVATHTALHMHT